MTTIDRDAVDAVLDRTKRAVEEEGLPAAQVALCHHGDLVASRTFGASDRARFVGFSTTKAVTSGTLVHLLSTSVLALDDRAATWIPEFDRDGFRDITIEHLLTYRSGFPHAPMRPLEAGTRDARGKRYAAWRLDWPAGERYEYHPTSAHWILADIAEAVTGRPLRQLVREQVLDPLGLDGIDLGVPEAEQDDVQRVAMVGGDVAPGRAIGDLFPEATPEILTSYANPTTVAVGVPGAGVVTTAAALAQYVSAWLRPDAGPWSAEWIADTTTNIRVRDVDPTTQVPANRTLSFVVAGDDGNQGLRELGPSVGPRTFGCSGLGGQVAWADPDSGLAFCFLTSGINHDLVASWMRGYQLSDLAAQCVG